MDLLWMRHLKALAAETANKLSIAVAAGFFALSLVFVWRSFYRMRIGSSL